MSTALIAGLSSIMLTFAALPPVDEAAMDSHRKPVVQDRHDNTERHEAATPRHGCNAKTTPRGRTCGAQAGAGK